MKSRHLILLFLALTVSSEEAEQNEEIDWCKMKNCDVNRHIACNNNETWSPNCVDQYLIPFSDSDKQSIINNQNYYRNQVAIGNVTGYPSASRMGSLSWDNQLAWLAELNTRQCVMAHDNCRNTPKYVRAGQNLYLAFAWTRYSTSKVIDMMAPKWFNEWKMGVAGDVENFTLPAFNKGIGHFTQMIQDQGTKVGCAMASFSTFCGVVPYKGYLVCCNYDRSNMRNFPVYKFGKPASGCKTGRDPDYPALCSKSEEIDPNLSFH